MRTIHIQKLAGVFAENKDIARDLRLKIIMPSLEKKEEITIDFKDVEGATQSFIHALISDAIRQYGSSTLDQIIFKNCNPTIQRIVTIVADYMQVS